MFRQFLSLQLQKAAKSEDNGAFSAKETDIFPHLLEDTKRGVKSKGPTLISYNINTTYS